MEGNAVFPVTAKDSRFLRLLIVTSLSSLMALFLWLIIETEASAAGVSSCGCRVVFFSVNQQRTESFKDLKNHKLYPFLPGAGKEEACSPMVATVGSSAARVQAQLSLCTLEVTVKAAFVEVLS